MTPHSSPSAPIALFDQPDDDPEICWVEVTVGDEDAARDYLASSCSDENFKRPFRPVGPACREWHRPKHSEDEEEWEKCAPSDERAREFWRVEVF